MSGWGNNTAGNWGAPAKTPASVSQASSAIREAARNRIREYDDPVPQSGKSADQVDWSKSTLKLGLIGSGKKPAAKKPTAKKPTAKKPAAKKPAAKKPAAKKPAAKK